MAGRVLAVELGDDGLRAAVVESTLRRLRITEVVELGDAEFAATLGAGRWDRVAVGLGGESAVFRFLELPFSDRRRIAQTAAVALEDHVPFSLEDGETAWDRSAPSRRSKVLAVMVPRQGLEGLRARLLSLGIPRAELVWGPTAALECFRRCQAGDATFIAIDTSPAVTSVSSVREGRLTGLRVLTSGSQERIARDLAWAVTSLAPDIERLLCAGPRAGQTMEELSQRLEGHSVERLAGDCPIEAPEDLAGSWVDNTTLLGLVAAVGGECGHPSITFGHGNGGAAGLEEAGLRRLGFWAAAAALLLASAAGLDHIRLEREHRALVRQTDAITARAMPSAAGSSGRKLKLEMRLSELERRMGERSSAAAHSSPLATLVAMSSAVTGDIDIELDSYQYDPPTIRLTGHAADYESVTKLEEALRADKYFSAVEVIEVRAEVSGKGVDFRLEIVLSA